MVKQGFNKVKPSYWDLLLREFNNQHNNTASYYYLPRKPVATKPILLEYNVSQTVSSYKAADRASKRYSLSEPFSHVYLTQREAESIRAILQEKTLTAAARQLQLSPRTVEFYFENVKKKLKCRKKKDVITLIKKYGLLNH